MLSWLETICCEQPQATLWLLTVYTCIQYWTIWQLQCFSTASAYRAFFIGQTEIRGARCLKKARAPGKCKFIIWLVLHGRCWTAERRKRHNLQDDDTLRLMFSRIRIHNAPAPQLLFCEGMFLVLRHLHWHALAPDGRCLDLADWWTASRKSLAKEDRKCFDSLVILTSWMIWNERNRRTFDSRAKTVGELVSCLEDEATSWVLARFRHISAFAAVCGRVTGRLVLAV